MGTDVSDAESTEEIDPRMRTLEENQAKMMDMLSRLPGQGTMSGLPTPRGKAMHFDIGSPPGLESDSEMMQGVEQLIARLNAADSI
eukprot:4730284-Heterocapsa_arctica.AAC.1